MTLWEWLALLVVAGGFATVLAAGVRRAPLVDQARTLKNELEEIDRVIRLQEKNGNHPADGAWDPEDFRPLVKEKFRRLRETGCDPFGGAYPAVPDGRRPEIAPATVLHLKGRVDPAFWSPFRVGGSLPPPDIPSSPP